MARTMRKWWLRRKMRKLRTGGIVKGPFRPITQVCVFSVPTELREWFLKEKWDTVSRREWVQRCPGEDNSG